MFSQSPILVDFDKFKFAAEQIPLMKRAPAGAKGLIPTDTLLSPVHAGVIIETPTISTFVEGSGSWIVTVSVDARKLIDLCQRIKKIGATGNEIELFTKERDLWIKFNTTKFSIPTLYIEQQ